MKVLLVKPPGRKVLITMPGPDLGFGYLAAHLREAGHTVAILDCLEEGLSPSGLLDRLRGTRPDVVGFKVYTKDLAATRECLALLRSALPDVILLAGGPHVSALPRESLATLAACDYLIAGEAERGLVQLVDAVQTHGRRPPDAKLRAIPGLVYRSAKGAILSNAKDFPELDQLALPAWDLLAPERYSAAGNFHLRGGYVPVQTSRGCPRKCKFCGGFQTNGHRLRHRSPERVIAELRLLRDHHGIEAFSLIDDAFLDHKDHARRLLTALVEADLGMAWSANNGVRVDRLNPTILGQLERSGCYSVGLGIESGTDHILARMGKNLTVAAIEEQVRMARRHSNLLLYGFFVLGYPGETLADILATIRFAHRLPIDLAIFTLFSPHPGTPVFEELRKEGLIDLDDPSMFLYECPSVAVAGLPPWGLSMLQRLALASVYARPRALRQLRNMSWRQIAGAFLKGTRTLLLPRTGAP